MVRRPEVGGVHRGWAGSQHGRRFWTVQQAPCNAYLVSYDWTAGRWGSRYRYIAAC